MVRVGVVLPISMRVLRRLVAEARLVEQGPALDVARAHADHVASAVSDVFEAVAGPRRRRQRRWWEGSLLRDFAFRVNLHGLPLGALTYWGVLSC